MRILSLDLATKTGWAVSQDGVIADCGTWALASPKEITAAAKLRLDRRLDQRVPVLWHKLIAEQVRSPIDWLVWEDVQFSSSTMQTQLWSSLRTVCWLFATMNGIRTECLGVSKLKSFGAGHGGATKDMMAHALAKQMPERFTFCPGACVRENSGKILDDNCVDAIHLLKWAVQTLKT